MAVFCNMYTVSNISQQFISAEKVGIIYLFEPVFAALASYMILNESLSWRLLFGGTLILIATIISELNFNQKGVPLLIKSKAKMKL